MGGRWETKGKMKIIERDGFGLIGRYYVRKFLEAINDNDGLGVDMSACKHKKDSVSITNLFNERSL